MQNLRTALSLFALALALTWTASSAGASAGTSSVRVVGQSVSASGSELGFGDLDGEGAYFGFERRIGPRWGLEFGVGTTSLDSRRSFDTFGGLTLFTGISTTVEWTPVTVAANYHLTPDRRFDWYLAPRLGVALMEDLEIRSDISFGGLEELIGVFFVDLPFDFVPETVRLQPDDALLYGLRLGLDWPIGDNGWAAAGVLDIMALELKLADGPGVDLDPVTLGFGVSKSW